MRRNKSAAYRTLRLQDGALIEIGLNLPRTPASRSYP